MEKELKSYFLKILFEGIAIHASVMGIGGTVLYLLLGYVGMNDKKRVWVIPLFILVGGINIVKHIIRVYKEARIATEKEKHQNDTPIVS